MKIAACIIIIVLLAVFLSTPAPAAEGKDPKDYPWKRGYLNLGYYIAVLDSAVRFGEQNLGIGIELDVEEFLGLDTTDTSFRIDAGYRFGKTRRHKVDFSWFRFHRSASTFFDKVIEVPELPDDSGGGTIGPGEFQTVFDFDIYKLMYEYSVVFDKSIDLNLGVGLFITPIKIGYAGTINGVGSTRVEEDITAPLPVIGAGIDYAITPKWFIRQQLNLFYLEISNYKGGIANLQLALEWLPWKHFGFGLGVESMRVEIEAENSDVPGVDFRGNIGFSYFGAQFYVKAFF
jgi:hypothetical protein